MKFIFHIISLLVSPIRAVARLVRRMVPKGPIRPAEVVPRASYGVGVARTRIAPAWRKSVRWSVVLTGFALFVAMQLAMAYCIDQLWWWFIAAFFIIAGSVALAAYKPTTAFLMWLVISPVAFVLLRLDFGEGLPAITFDRIAIGGMTLLMILRTMISRRPPRKFLVGEWLMLAFLAYVAVIMFMVKPSTMSLTNLIADKLDHLFLAVIVYYITKASLTRKEHISAAMLCVVVVGFYTALLGFYEHYTGNQWFSAIPGMHAGLAFVDIERGRAAGPMLNPSAYGNMLAIATFVAVHLSIWAEQKRTRFFCLIAIPVMIVGCYFSYTRGAYLPMGVFLVVMPFLAKGGSKRFVGFIVAAALVGIAVTPMLLTGKAFHKRMTGMDNVYTRVINSATMLNVIKHNFWFGVGLGNADAAIDQYITNAGSLSGLYGRSYFPGQRKLTKAHVSHNSFLSIFAEMGAVGGTLYFGSFIAMIVHLFRIRARLPSKGLLGKDFVALMIVSVFSYWSSIATYDIKFFRFLPYVVMILFALAVRYEELLQSREVTEVVPVAAVERLAHA